MAKGTGQRTGAPAKPAESQTRRHGRAIEIFHAAFLQVAPTQLPVADFALKGGGNLRFFLNSKRRSADLDLDYLGRNFGRFAEQMDTLMSSRVLSELLRVQEITLRVDPARPRAKDTNTVKRWKFQLARPGMEDASSKIKFSNRDGSDGAVVEQTDTALSRTLRAVPSRLKHYPPTLAIVQKVGALAKRSETEPRDVFDLDHLFRQYPDALDAAALDALTTRSAIARAGDLTYDQYASLVIEFLEEDLVPLYGSQEAWEDMTLRVVERLEEKIR